jgi:phospholipid transport system substrate-binding protein
MKGNTWSLKFFSLLLTVCCTLFTLNLRAETPSPMPMLNTTADQVIHSLESQQSHLTTPVVYGIVNQYLIPQVDIYGMARSVLGRNIWNKATGEQKDAFSEQFVKLIVRTYASPLTEFTDEKIKFLPIRGSYEGKSFVNVNSFIVRSSGKNVPVTYSLVLIKGQWKIYDMSVEGVSLLQSFRSQFAQELTSGSLEQLISTMKKRNEQKSQAA